MSEIVLRMSVVRFSVSLEEELQKDLDQYVIDNKFSNRSQAIRHLIEKNIVEKKWQCNHEVAGAVILTFDHRKSDILKNLNDVQHDYHDEVLSSQHFHLDNDVCLEIIAVRGAAKRLTELSDKLIGIKGIIYGKLIMGRID